MESGQREGGTWSPGAREYKWKQSGLKVLESRGKPRVRKNEIVDQKDAKITLDIIQSQHVIGERNWVQLPCLKQPRTEREMLGT